MNAEKPYTDKGAAESGLFRAPGGGSYFRPFVMITVLFLLWGFAHGMLDVLDKHFQTTLHLAKAESAFVQFSVYIGYLVMGYPASSFMKKYGYQRGILLGLGLFAAGAFLFYPAAKWATFIPFLLALFVLACGLATIETAANPYTTALGPAPGAARRINIAQSLNGLGWITGPLIGSWFLFGAKQETGAAVFDSLTKPYLLAGSVVVVVAIVFAFIKLPVIKEEKVEGIEDDAPARDLWKHPAFIMAVLAEFFYVAAQTGVNSFFINYVTETLAGVEQSVRGIMLHLGGFGRIFMPETPEAAAALILSIGGMGSFFVGRMAGAWLMKFIRPQRLLAIYAIVNTILMIVVVTSRGWPGVIALFSCYFFMSLMFPTIFALGLRGLGPLTKKGAGFLVMSVAGGAFCPPLMGLIADHEGMPIAFIVPMFFFAFIAYFAISRKRPASEDIHEPMLVHH